MSTIELGAEDLAKYPFLREAGDHVKKLNLNLDDLSQPDYINIIERARKRILEAVKQGRVSSEIAEVGAEILSFPIVLILVKATGLEHLASRISYSEAVRVERLLEIERKPLIAYIFRSLLNIELIDIAARFGGQKFDFKIPITEYLRRSTQFHKPEWKLVNRVADRGQIYLKTGDLIRLIREEIQQIIYKRIKTMNVPQLPESLKAVVKEVSEASPVPSSYRKALEIAPTRYPPCVSHALDLLQKGQNIPHYGRFLMTTYLLTIGKTVEDIVTLFPKSPDFDERLTVYQVEHIAGLRGGHVKYKVPSCRTLQTHSFCFKIGKCDNIRSPIQFGREIPNMKKGRKVR